MPGQVGSSDLTLVPPSARAVVSDMDLTVGSVSVKVTAV
jgi:hypothetical protein